MKKLKLLLAEDDKTMQALFKEGIAIGSHKDSFLLTIVDNGKKAVEAYQEIKPDIVVLDVIMPVLNGYKALSEIRSLEERGKKDSAVIIMLTSLENKSYIFEASELGADGYIKKPYKHKVAGEAIYKCYKKIKIDAKKVDEKKANKEEQKRSSLYQWLDKYSVNVLKMDEQHKKLVNLINYFYTAKKERKEQAVLKASLNYLLSYTKTHFSHEEKLLEENSYPDLIPHKAIHKDLIDSLLDMKERFEGGDKDVADELSLLLLEWLFDHIAKNDKKYGKYLNSKNIT